MDGEDNRAKLLADADYDHYQVMYRYYYTDATNGLEASGAPIIDTYWTFWVSQTLCRLLHYENSYVSLWMLWMLIM